MTTHIYTNKGWQDITLDWDDNGIVGVNCCDCGEQADRITNAGKQYGPAILWAHCANCGYESRAESTAASRAQG